MEDEPLGLRGAGNGNPAGDPAAASPDRGKERQAP